MHLAENVYFSMAKETTTFKLWEKLQDVYEKQSSSSKLNEDTLALPVRLHTKDVEARQHGKCEANINSTSDDNPTIGKRLSIYRRGEKAKWKDTLGISNRKYHVHNGSDPTSSCICRRRYQPVHVKPKTKALGGLVKHIAR